MRLIDALAQAQFSVAASPSAARAQADFEHTLPGVIAIDTRELESEAGRDLVAAVASRRPTTQWVIYGGPEVPLERRAKWPSEEHVASPVRPASLVARLEVAWLAHDIVATRPEFTRACEAFFQLVPGAVWFLVEDGKIREINDEGATLLGYRPEELVGSAYDVLLDPSATHPGTRWVFEERRTSPRATRHELVAMRCRDGTLKWLECNAIRVYDRVTEDTATPRTATLTVAWDVTEAKKLEHRLRRSELELQLKNRIANAFLTTPDEVMFAHVLQVVLDALESTCGIFGYVDEQGALVAASFTDDLLGDCPPHERTRVFTPQLWGGMWGRALHERRSLVSNERGHVPSGHVHIDRSIVVPLVHGDDVVGLFVVANKQDDYGIDDVTLLEAIAEATAPLLHAHLEQQASAQALRRSEENYRRVVESSPNAILTFDMEARLEHANAKAQRLFGCEGDTSLQGHAGLELVAPEHRANVASLIQDLFVDDVYGSLEAVMVRPDGSQFHAELSAARLEDGAGHPIGFMLSFRDLTERRRMEALQRRFVEMLEQRRDDERRHVARELHDEIGAALTSLTIGLRSIADDPAADALRERLETLQTLADRSVRDVGRIARGLHPALLERFGLTTALREHVRDFQNVNRASVDLHVGELPATLSRAAELTAFRVVQEGLSNIAKHAEAENVSVVVDGNGDGLRVAIEDDGKGLDGDVFQSAHKGLGLFGIRERLVALGGELVLEPTPGGGTTLVALIPTQEQAHEP